MSEETPVLAVGHFNPWKTMWLRPRATIRALVEHDPTLNVDRLAILMGMTQMIQQNSGDGTLQSVLVTLAFTALLGPIIGLLGIRISGAISGWIGRKLGGTATNEEVRAAFAWGALPRVAALPLQLIFLLMIPLFSATNPAMGILLVALGGLLTVLGLWEMVLTVAALAEVNRFSIVRAIATLFLPVAIILGIFALCALPALLAATR